MKYQFIVILFVELILCVLFYYPLLYPLHTIGIIDQDYFLAWQLLINDALRSGHILHWTHHFCGGVPALANPQSGALSPFNLIGLFFNPVVQMKVNLFIHFVICGAGFHLICKRLNISPHYGILGFIIWVFNGFITFRILHGQLTFYPLLNLPLLFAFLVPYLNSKQKTVSFPDVLGGVIITALIILEDGFQVLIYTEIFLFSVALYMFLIKRNMASIKLIIYWIFFSTGLCAIRILPVVELLYDYPRYVLSEDFMTLRMVYDAFFNPGQLGLYNNFIPVHPHNVWAAYGAFIGWVPVILLFFTVFVKYTSHIITPLVFGLVISLLLMMGHFSEFSPWNLLHSIPVFEFIRFPHRFSSMVIFAFSIISMVSIDAILKRYQNRFISKNTLLIMICFFTFGSLYFTLHPVVDTYANSNQPVYDKIDYNNNFEHSLINPNYSYSQIASNKSVYNCYRALVLPNSALLKAPVVLSDNPDEKIAARIKPNTFEIELLIKNENSTIYINENYNRNWNFKVGNKIMPVEYFNGIMKVSVPENVNKLTIQYIPFLFYDGLKISLVWLLMLISIYFVWRKRTRN